jgi:hypothetical protein
MKTKYPWLLALTVTLCLLALTIHAQKQTSGRTTWEYKTVFSTSGDLGYVLNDVGGQGWEMVAFEITSDRTGLTGKTYYLKRAK